MLRSYLTMALRQLKRQKMYAAIKVGGFALSIAACIMIALFIRDELSFDHHYGHADRAFRIVDEENDPVDGGRFTAFQAPMAQAVLEDFPEVEKAGRLMPGTLFYGAGSNQIRRADQQKNTYEQGFSYADQDLLDILGIPLIYGKAGHALDRPNTIVLTKRKADKYFPGQDPVGKIFYLNNDIKTPYTVGGVIPDFGSRSSLQYDFLLSLKDHELWKGEQTYWGANNYETYLLLRPGANAASLQKRITDLEIKKHVVPAMKAYGVKDAEEKAKLQAVALQPVSDIYLRSTDIRDELPSHGDIRLVWMFGGIACFILLIACINFINLATAKSANRAKEVGLRKVIGSQRSTLVRQFLAESMVYSLLSFLFALVLALIFLPFFNHLTSKELSLPWGKWWFAVSILVAIAGVGLASGLYPAWYLSSFQPIKVLKGQLSRGSKNSRLRSALVVFQFTTSIILIIGTFVVYRQMQFILHKKVGFDKDQVLLIQGTNTISDIQSFKNDLVRLPQVRSVSVSDYLPVHIADSKYNGNSFYVYSKRTETPPIFGQFWIVDYDYIPTMGMKMVEGRNFSKSMAGDTAAVVINQSMVHKLDLGPHPVGSIITNFGTPFHVIGVIEDFNYWSFRDEIRPLCLFLGISPSVVSMKINSAEIGNLIPQVTAVWKKYVPNQDLRYTFMDESFRDMYADVDRTGTILTSFTVLAIIVACLGLFGLSSFLAEQRTKEIGIRKVLGASLSHLLMLLSKDFVLLILLSLLIASPIAWWGMHTWLKDFAYRQEISWWIFVAVGGAALAIALLTTGFQSLKTAMDNPINSLKTE